MNRIIKNCSARANDKIIAHPEDMMYTAEDEHFQAFVAT